MKSRVLALSLGGMALMAGALAACASGTSSPTVQTAATQVSGQATTVAPTTQSAATQAAGTVTNAATVVAPTVNTAATQVAGTVPAAAGTAGATVTAAAPTAQAGATQAAGTVGPAAGTASAALPVTITEIKLNNNNPVDNAIVLKNQSNTPVDLSGWKLRVGGERGSTATLPSNARIEPNGTLEVHTYTGNSSGNVLYLGEAGSSLAVSLGFAFDGKIELLDPSGKVVSGLDFKR